MPQLSQKPQQTRVRVLAALVTALVLDDALADPWRDDERRHADAQTRKVERDVSSRRGLSRYK
jgi:hypothetical protein